MSTSPSSPCLNEPGRLQTSSSSTKFKVETGACRDTAGWPLRHGGPRSDGGADGLSDYPEFQEFRRISAFALLGLPDPSRGSWDFGVWWWGAASLGRWLLVGLDDLQGELVELVDELAELARVVQPAAVVV